MLAAEALAGLALEAGGVYVDATFGRGGHTALILQALGPEGRVLALDRDPQAIAAGRERFADEVRWNERRDAWLASVETPTDLPSELESLSL